MAIKRNWMESPEIIGHFTVINTDSPILHSKVGDVDFRTISLEKAKEVYESGTDYLKKLTSYKNYKSQNDLKHTK